jgi:hypothetical protein
MVVLLFSLFFVDKHGFWKHRGSAHECFQTPSRYSLVGVSLFRRRYQVLFGQGFQHLLVALAAADLLPAPAVESRLVAVDSGHVFLLPA